MNKQRQFQTRGMRIVSRPHVILLLLLAAFAPLLSRAQGTDRAERILFDARIFTGIPDHPYAEAVAIRGDKISAVGNLPDVSRAASASGVCMAAQLLRRASGPTRYQPSGFPTDLM